MLHWRDIKYFSIKYSSIRLAICRLCHLVKALRISSFFNSCTGRRGGVMEDSIKVVRIVDDESGLCSLDEVGVDLGFLKD